MFVAHSHFNQITIHGTILNFLKAIFVPFFVVHLQMTLVCEGYFKTARGYVIYSPRVQPEVNKSRAHEVS